MLSPRCTWPVPSTGIFLQQTRPPLPQKARRNASATKNGPSVSDRPPAKFPCRHDFLYLPVKYIKWEREREKKRERRERGSGKSRENISKCFLSNSLRRGIHARTRIDVGKPVWRVDPEGRTRSEPVSTFWTESAIFPRKNVSPYRERNFLRSRSILSDTKEKIKGIVNCERRDASRKIVAGILRDERTWNAQGKLLIVIERTITEVSAPYMRRVINCY